MSLWHRHNLNSSGKLALVDSRDQVESDRRRSQARQVAHLRPCRFRGWPASRAVADSLLNTVSNEGSVVIQFSEGVLLWKSPKFASS
jgi:hypothetical protein